MTETCRCGAKFYLKIWMYSEDFSNEFPCAAELLVDPEAPEISRAADYYPEVVRCK